MTIYEDIFWTALLVIGLPIFIVIYVVLMTMGVIWNLIKGNNIFKKSKFC